ncbi:MAG: YsnF/AvaK domain-containing protein, partial [Actinomycetes bacterium]
YYGLEPAPSGRQPAPSGQQRGPVGQGTSGLTTDDAMIRSEERMRVGVERRETGRVRLRKYVVTEEVQQPVQVSHEEVRLEREPITAENRGRAMSGPEISEEKREVTLHAERPVVRTEVNPVERVRLAKDTVSDEETVRGKIRKERIETETVDERNRTR